MLDWIARVKVPPCAKLGVSSSKGVGARGHNAEETETCPEGTILTRLNRHLHGTCITPGCTYPESFVSLRPSVRRFGPASIVLRTFYAAARGGSHVTRGAT